jgi:hypothetical protein
MKTASSGFAAHLQGKALTLAACMEIVRLDGQAFRWTDHDEALVVDGNTYLPKPGFTRAAVTSNFDMSVAESEAQIAVDDDAIDVGDLRAGLWDYATVRLFVVNWSNLGQGILRLRKGRIGQVVVQNGERATAELRGLAQNLQQEVVRLYTSECTADLGDAKCRVPLRPPERTSSTAYAAGSFVVVSDGTSPGIYSQALRIYECTTGGITDADLPTFDPALGATTLDGTVVWTAREAWSRPATVETVVDGATLRFAEGSEFLPTHVDGWFAGGVLRFETGLNAGVVREILAWNATTREVRLFLNAPALPEAGDVVTLQPGCAKRLTDCQEKFDNRLNFRGFPHVPGATVMMEFLWTLNEGEGATST